MYSVVAIGDKDFCAGFALAGLETLEATASSLAHEIEQAIQSGTYGLIIIDEQFHDSLKGIRPAGAGSTIPIVIPVPGRMHWHDTEPLDEDQYIAALVRRAVGYQVDLHL